MFHTNNKWILFTITFLVVSYSYGSCIPSSSKHINCTTTTTAKPEKTVENQTEPVAEPEVKTKSFDVKNTIPAKLKTETTTVKNLGTKVQTPVNGTELTTPTSAVSANVTEVVTNMPDTKPTVPAPLKIEDREGKSLHSSKTAYEHASPEPEPEAEPEKNATVNSTKHTELKSSKLTNENSTSSKPSSSAHKPGSSGSESLVVVNEMFLIGLGLSLFLQW